MSIYFTTLFVILTLEMALLFFLVLPLPHRMRKFVYKTYFQLTSSGQFKTVLYIFAGIIGLLFIDSWKRANIPVSMYHHVKGDETELNTSTQVLATRAFNQRNVYISGFILYFLIGIPTVFSIIRRLVKYQDLLIERAQKEGKEGETKDMKDEKLGNSNKVEPSVKELEDMLHDRNVSLEGLLAQVKNFEKYYDEMDKSLPEEVSVKKTK
ncbi:Endoplasmic reticulum transmembrane protein 1 [Nakaseomyces bracarensis]|uniref:Endoplasmic reticulum transmembrane protein n=1 Tax=Nakaseomyces bracarensis TaxID=273131 RepID=A0ABR4NRM8_9SACH